MLQLFYLQYQIKKGIKKCHQPLVKQYLQGLLSQLSKPISELELLAIDLEMTGLDAKKDQIVSIGLIPIINMQISPKQAQHRLVKIQGSVGQSATIHGVIDSQLASALSREEALLWLLTQSKDKVLVAHHARLDMEFIRQALIAIGFVCPRLPAIDTFIIEKQRLLRKHQEIKSDSLRLNACRSRYNLPIYDAHNALSDALSCAELLLAQLSNMSKDGDMQLAQLLRLH